MSLPSIFVLPRSPNFSLRQIILAYGGRFSDELLGGLPDVLMPTIQQQLGLSLAQIALLRQVMEWVSQVIDPVHGLLLDVWDRRWLMGLGAAGVGLSIVLIGLAPTFALLLLAYALYGAAGGPLTHTGDVLVVEAYPTAPDRAYTRSVLFDTIGAALAPLLVAGVFWLGLDWRWLLLGIGAGALVYALLILRTGFPPSPHAETAGERPLWQTLGDNLREVLASPEARRWLIFLFCFQLLETPFVLKTVWLAQEVGMSQALVGVYVATEMGVGVVSLLALDRWRARAETGHVLQVVTGAVALLFPLWLLVPGVASRFVLMIPLAFFFAMFWPISKASALTAAPGRAGAVTAVSSLFGFVPLPLFFGLLAQAIGLTAAMLAVFLPAVAVMGWLVKSA
ncbi:MAG: MFS transporter [Caldilineaceae bacterium]|nr:MFS transporter [Caldilineaceae bacterium]